MSLIMASSASPILDLCPSTELKDVNEAFVFDSALLKKQANLPSEFIWPQEELVHTQAEELKEPLIDLGGFSKGDNVATARAVELIRAACLNHGFFQVTNHGVDASLIRAAYEEVDSIFKMPLSMKLSVRRKPGCVSGYSGAHADRYSSKLPWKETFSFGYHGNESRHIVVNYFKSILGEDYEQTG